MSWSKVQISSCTKIVGGSTPDTNSPQFWGGTIPWATPKDLSDLDGALISKTPRMITKLGLASCSSELLPVDSVLFSSRAPIGHVAINTVPMATNQGFKSFVPDPKKLDARFLYHWLRTNKSYLQTLGNGATFKEVSKEVVSRIEIPLPPIAEQRRIAAILDQAEALRAKRRQALAKLDTLTRSIFHSFNSSPRGTGVSVAFKEIASFKTGKLDSNASVENGRYPFFTCDREDHLIDVHAFDQEALLLAGNNAAGEYSVKYFRGKFNAYQRTYVITLDESICDYAYVRFALTEKLRDLKQLSKGTGTKYLTIEILHRLRFALPELNLQKRFAAQASEIDAQKALSMQHQAQLDALATGMQHRAFQGEL